MHQRRKIQFDPVAADVQLNAPTLTHVPWRKIKVQMNTACGATSAPFRRNCLATLTTILSIILGTICFPLAAIAGDLDSAKQQLEKVKVDLSNSTWGSFQDDIKATEAFLDGLPASDRAPVQKELDDLKAKGAAGFKDYKSKMVLDTAKRDLDSAADSIASDPAGAKSLIDKTNDLLKSDDAKTYADAAQVTKLQARAASLQAMTTTTLLEYATPIVKELDDLMASQPFKNAKTPEAVDSVVQDINRLKSRIAGALERLPSDDSRALAIKSKVASYDKVVADAAGSAGADQAAAQLAYQWKGQQEYFAGWDKEPEGPSWDDYIHHQTENMSNLNMPKTVDLLNRMRQWFKEDSIKSTAETYKDNPSVKATMADAHKVFDAAAVKLDAAFKKILTDAEKVETPQDPTNRNKAGGLADDADMWLKETPFHDADTSRARKLSEKWSGNIAGGLAAQQAAMEKLTADANAAWPKIAGGITAVDGFTPDKLDQFRGKVIHLKGNNRLGWDYEPGSYNFEREINGMAVAGKFDANVSAAVADAHKQTGQDLPDENWDAYATVEGPGKIDKRVTASGDVSVDGQKVGTVKSERDQTVDCAVVRIFALHAGPVAVGASGMAFGAPGAAAAAGASSSGGGMLVHLFELALCLAAAGLIVMTTRPALAGQVGLGTASAHLSNRDQIAKSGLAFLALGLLWMLYKLILGDLFPAALLSLSGACLAADWLQSRNILPLKTATVLKANAVPIAGATLVFGILHLFLANWYLF